MDEKYRDPNNVNAINFNITLKGYLERALKESNLDDTTKKKVRSIMNYSLDMMTMEEARNYYFRN